MSDPPLDTSTNATDTAATSRSEATIKTSYYLLMVYAALFGAGAAVLAAAYITLYNWGVKFFQKPRNVGVSIGRFWPLVLLTLAGVLLGLALKFLGRHSGLGVAQQEYGETGRVTPRYLPAIMLQAFIVLWSGAAVGPEGPLTFLSGGVGSFVADKLKIEKDDVPLLVYSAIAGAFGGFFGSPVVGAVGALEYMFIHELNFYRHVIPGLLAAAFGYSVYFALLHTAFLGIFNFPSYASPRLVDLVWALVVGVVAGILGVLFQLVFGVMHLLFAPLQGHPALLAILGGVLIGLVGSFLPLALYSGQSQLLQIIHNPGAYGIGFLLLMVLVKAVLTSTSFATGFEGGPVFPLLFIGGTLGLALSKLLPFIPQGVGVTAGMAGVASAGFPIPLTITLLLGIMGGQPDLLPITAIGAVVGFLVARALKPLLPQRPEPPGAATPSGQAGRTE